ncbi:MAG: hypothetical protein HRT89_24760 [Lentisphaeria bacterium]|nr:archaemetzincin [Lentisphaeria bacterium]NQZ71269.1 hypothetical protein [Lentisphaeria bacterium]
MKTLFFLMPMLIFSQGEFNKKRSNLLAKESLKKPFDKLSGIHVRKKSPGSSDWLFTHKEAGQSFLEYQRFVKVKKGKKYKYIYVKQIGDFSKNQLKVAELSKQYLSLYFNCKVEAMKPMAVNRIPPKYKRKQFGTQQILSTYVLYNILKPRRPKDALAVIALCSSDLWPGKGWNFVYGQASLRERIGVWSIHRNGNPDKQFATCLRRTIKTATHETGHILGLKHCITYECNMNGSNHMAESDNTPLALCPVCLKKLSWNVNSKPLERYKKLANFCKTNKLEKEMKFFNRSIKILSK